MLLEKVQFQGHIISNPFKAKTGSRPTHEIRFTEKNSEINQWSGISELDKFTKKKLEKYKMNVLEIFVAESYASQKADIFL